MSELLFKVHDGWSQNAVWKSLEEMYRIAEVDLELSLFPNQIMLVNDEGMLEAYATQGLPHLYPHWSFGKSAQQLLRQLKSGMPLAYELIMPTDPCIMYCLASNSMATTATVMAHAGIGHNHVYKNNFLYAEHTNARGLADYCRTARDMILDFEARFGKKEVEQILDAAHALQLPGGVYRRGKPQPFDPAKEKALIAEYMRNMERSYDATIAATVPSTAKGMFVRHEIPDKRIEFPQENILMFVAEHSPKLLSWQREVVKMVSTIAQQTSLPGVQVKILHEGAAMFCEEYVMRKLYDEGRLDDGTWLEVIHLNEGVLRQPKTIVDKEGNLRQLVARHNPYTFGRAMFRDIVRICGPRDDADRRFFAHAIDMSGPTPEDRKHFKSFAGSGDWRGILKDAMANYQDSTFIQQYLSPQVVRDLELAVYVDRGDHWEVTAIHNEDGFHQVRDALAMKHSFDGKVPRVEIVEADLLSEARQLKLEYTMHQGMRLEKEDKDLVTYHLMELWGYDVHIATK